MNWDAIGAAAEIVGSAAVLLTLVYLAVQMRQSSTIAMAESTREITRQWDDALQDLIRNNATMLPAMRDLGALDEMDRYVAISRMARLIQAHGMATEQSVLHVLPERHLAVMDQALASVLTTPGGRAYWAVSNSAWFHPGRVESIIQAYEGPSWIEFFDEFECRLGSDIQHRHEQAR